MFLEKNKSRIEAEFAKRAAEVPAVKEAEKELAEEILSPIAVLTCVAFVSKVPSFKAAEV